MTNRNRNTVFLLSLCWLMLLGVVSCKNDSSRMSVYGWKLTGKPSDSILERLDSLVYNYADPDTISSVVGEYCRQSQNEDSENLYLHRRLYWAGTAEFMQGNYEKGDSLRLLAMNACDSTRFPHDYLVYRFSIEQPDDLPDNACKYDRYTSDLKSFIRYGDLACGFSRAVQLSQLMSEAGLHDRALNYALLADSLLAETGLQKLRSNNRVNIASCLFTAGDTVGAVRILTDMLAQSTEVNPVVEAIVNFNIFQMNGDTLALRNSWNIIRDAPELSKMRPLVVAGMVKSGLDIAITGDSDIVEMLREGADYSYLPEEEIYIDGALTDALVKKRDWNKLPEALIAYEDAVDNFIKAGKAGEVVAAETKVKIDEVEANAARRYQDRIILFWIIFAVVIAISALVVISLIVRLNKMRQVELLTQIEVEQKKRRQLSTKVKALKTDKVDIRPTATCDEQSFMAEFIQLYPRVSKTGRKLAVYIWKGFDTIEIAREMNIRKESVMQARWRLRRQMELQPEEDLEVTIISILRNE